MWTRTRGCSTGCLPQINICKAPDTQASEAACDAARSSRFGCLRCGMLSVACRPGPSPRWWHHLMSAEACGSPNRAQAPSGHPPSGRRLPDKPRSQVLTPPPPPLHPHRLPACSSIVCPPYLISSHFRCHRLLLRLRTPADSARRTTAFFKCKPADQGNTARCTANVGQRAPVQAHTPSRRDDERLA